MGRVLGTDIPSLFETDVRGGSRLERLAHREIVVALAGQAAQCHFCGQPEEPGGAGQDYSSAFGLADRICSSAEETEALVKWLEVRAKMLIQHPRNADAIKTVAAALLEHKRLSATAVRKLFRQAYLPPARPPAASHSGA